MIVEGASADLKWLLQRKRVEMPSRGGTNNDKPNSAKMSKTWDIVSKGNTGNTSKIRTYDDSDEPCFSIAYCKLIENLIRR